MELYKVAKVNFKNYPESFKNDFIEFLISKGYIYYKKRNKVIIYGMKPDSENPYPTEEELKDIVDKYIDKYIIDFNGLLSENEVTKGVVSVSLVNKIENPNNEEQENE